MYTLKYEQLLDHIRGREAYNLLLKINYLENYAQDRLLTGFSSLFLGMGRS